MCAFRLPAWLIPTALKAIHFQARILHPMTLGVRAIILDRDDRVFLVRHSYVPGWYCPGGGVEVGETARQALVREVEEEGNIIVDGAPLLHGVFFNRKASRRNHVLVYVVRDFRVRGPRLPDWEIVESGFFDSASLPPDATPATRARLAEVLHGAPRSDDW